jgi:hypothetical protein
MVRVSLVGLTVTILGCSPDYGVEIEGEGLTAEPIDNAQDDDEGSENEEDEVDPEVAEAFEDAIIRIVYPPSGEFLAYGEAHTFEAVIQTPDGDELAFADIAWTSDADDEWGPAGDVFETDSIDVGTHNITAEATLPDGSRVAHTVGGVLVQHEAAGTYVGDMIIELDMEFDGTPVGTSCIGAALIVVDEYGEIAEGGSACTLDVLGYFSMEINHSFEYNIDGADIGGDAFVMIPFLGFGLPFGSEGQLVDGQLTSDWEGSFSGYIDIGGTLDVTRLTREITSL